MRREPSTQCQQDSDTTDEYKEKNKAAMLDRHGSRQRDPGWMLI